RTHCVDLLRTSARNARHRFVACQPRLRRHGMSELLDPFFLLGQLRSGLTTAMFLFLIASGLSLIFGVLKIINFAHGSLYMIGAYIAWNTTIILGRTSIGFLGAVMVASLSVAVLGGIVERLLLRHLFKREELYQLLFTYAPVLIFSYA